MKSVLLFDGDEMNCHIPQTIQTVAELILIADASKHFISPTISKVVINAKQDTVMGSYVLSNVDTRLNWRDVMNILMTTSNGINNTIPKHKLIAGKLMYSNIIPNQINIDKKNNGVSIFKIHNGQLDIGVLGKSEIGAIIQKMWFQYGSKDTQIFIDDMQRMMLQFLMNHGYTVGVKDAVVPKQVHEDIYTIIESKRKEAMGAITEYENDPYVMTSYAFETYLDQNLQSIQSDIQKIIMNNLENTGGGGIFICISSGSSGTAMNAGQIIGCIGQVVVENKRIQMRFNNRTLPIFAQYDNSPFARGFCYNSFISGLNPAEFFFQVMAGREGIINTAIKTADTGYIQRKLIKILEDIKVEYDGTVRNANDKIIQCVYGDNGINVEKQIMQRIDLIGSNNATVREKYIYTQAEIDILIEYGANQKYTSSLNEKLYKKLIAMRDRIRVAQKAISVSSIAFEEEFMMPVDIRQYITNIVNRTDRDTERLVDPYYVLARIKNVYSGSYCKIMKYNDRTSIIKRVDEQRIKLLFKFYLYDVLAPKKCTHLYRFNSIEFDEIIEYIKKTIILAKVDGGEMVGFVGAHSIGEPVTQANLKSFHKSGTGKAVTGGLGRVKELLSVTKNQKTPITEIYVNDAYKNNKVIVSKIASYLKYTTMHDIVASVDIYYDPDPYSKTSVMSRDNVANIFEGNPGKSGCQSDITGLPWVLKLTLSKEKMIDRNISMLEIQTSFCHNWEMRYEDSKGSKKEYKKIIEKITQCAIVSNFDNSPTPIVHIRFDANNYNFNTLIQFQEMIINKYRIKGIPNIMESNNIIEEKYIDFDTEGNVQTLKQHVIYAEGINLHDMAQINGIDLLKSRCNDIVIIYETYGVEAARAAFIREFIIANGSSGGVVNYQHVELLADTITHMGGLIAVNRHGANKLDTDPFSRASFEKTVEQLLNAAAFGEADHIRSVSARIMVGALINGGTGCFDILLDHDKVKKTLIPKEEVDHTITIKKKTSVSDLIKKKKTK